MAQLVVRNLEDDVRDKLRDRALTHGHSMEEEVRDILRAAVMATPDAPRKLGSLCRDRFAENPEIGDEPFEIEELRGCIAEPITFDE